MKCENCGNELTGTLIICPGCNHNNAKQCVKEWRARRASVPQASNTRRVNQFGSTRSSAPKPDADVNLVRFPAPSNPATVKQHSVQSETKTESEISQYPPWRAQLKEKVRMVREKRSAQLALADYQDDEAALDTNPIVEAALKRIRWVSHTPAITASARSARTARTARTGGYGAQATALAEEVVPDVDPHIDPQPREIRPARQQIKQARQPVPQRIEPAVATPAVKRIEPRPAVNKVETKTLTPKPGISARPELKDKPVSRAKTITPLSKAPTPIQPQEAKREEAEREPEPENKIPTKSIETQIIEVPLIISELPDIYPRPSTLWVRTLAGACDFEIIAMAFLPIFTAYATLNTSLGNEAFFILTLLLGALTFVYQALTLALADRTFGMALLNLRLVNNEDDTIPITRRQKLLRAWAASIAFLFPPLNFVIMRLNRHRRSLPDLISGTTPIEQ